jgi:hypothetical protein
VSNETPDFQEGTEPVELPGGQLVPSAEQWNLRAVQIDRELHRLRMQFLFLFGFLLVCMILVSFYQQAQVNQTEYNRYDMCQERATAIREYNAVLPHDANPLPLPNCGVNPRTD